MHEEQQIKQDMSKTQPSVSGDAPVGQGNEEALLFPLVDA